MNIGDVFRRLVRALVEMAITRAGEYQRVVVHRLLPVQMRDLADEDVVIAPVVARIRLAFEGGEGIRSAARPPHHRPARPLATCRL